MHTICDHFFSYTVAVFNLSAPRVVYEQNLTFSAMISLIAPSGGSTLQIEIDIMEIGITATPFGEYTEQLITNHEKFVCHSKFYD